MLTCLGPCIQEGRGPEREQEGSEPVVVAVGAHYKSNVASPEEVLLYVVKVDQPLKAAHAPCPVHLHLELLRLSKPLFLRESNGNRLEQHFRIHKSFVSLQAPVTSL